MSKKAVVLLSGGLDSSTLLYQLRYEGFDVAALSVDYGQRHRRELDAAAAVAEAFRPSAHVTLQIADPMRAIFEGANSSQVGGFVEVPTGHYADESMKRTVVPNRNMVLIALAGAFAVSQGAHRIGYAAHAGDHPIYPDCRPEFYRAMDAALHLANEEEVGLYAPFINISKTDIVRRADQFGVPLHLTYSCYAGRPQHCGKCGTCFERREAFRDADVIDPTAYEAAAV